ncbi:PriCT-2 domain-containing protein [Bradyrhizobium sp. SRL28]|uniref:PriCT-2 domain-containing protein n=1 Tax=Bradyrhizobium sp. SRL28 TaxID=2836178 RepID=UPI001BDF1AE1|nr:PriCT-2 domain-containing protein [Bradyrhizobium sp. SRL28]MBT1511784.1 PriCT-2 domain-containing protein [Bradyrhizobium sp. SRL28]
MIDLNLDRYKRRHFSPEERKLCCRIEAEFEIEHDEDPAPWSGIESNGSDADEASDQAADAQAGNGAHPDPIDCEPASDLDTRKLTITLFADEYAASQNRVDMTLPQLAEHIRFQTAASKMALPWLKLATFGNQRSDKNCLRTNENVLQISGIEGDHDSGELPFDDAVEIIRKANIRALLCTSPSYVPGAKERWRILVPLSRNREPAVREKFVARINGLLGGYLAPESFMLSLSYLYGHLEGREHRVEIIDGDYLDLRDDTYAGSIFKDGSRVSGQRTGHDFNDANEQQRSRANDDPRPVDIFKIEAALEAVDSNCSYEVWLHVAAALHHELGESGFAPFDWWSAKAPQYTREESLKRWRGARTMGSVTIATLFHYADQADPTWRTRYEEKQRQQIKLETGGGVGGGTGGPGVLPGSHMANISLQDFYAYLPRHTYIFAPTGEMWVAISVNSRLPGVPMLKKDGSPVLDENGKPQYYRPSHWLDKNRAVEQLSWAPGLPEVIKGQLISEGGWFVREGCYVFNLYKPPLPIPKSAEAATLWLNHLRKIYADDADHIIKWLAHRVQRPHEKINHAIVLGGKQGIGKDTLLEPVKRAVGPWNFIEVSPQMILGRFNGHLKSVVLRISEARDLGEFDRFKFYDHTKSFIAAPPDVLRIDEKHRNEYAIPNVCGVIITTNHKSDGIFLPPDDRRHFVAWSDFDKSAFSPAYWNELWQWYGKGGLDVVAHYLATLDLSDFDPKAPPPQTPAFFEIANASRTPEDAELADALDEMGWPDAVTIFQVQVASKSNDFVEFLKDRRNSRKIPHRFESCDYTPVRNPDAKDGLWRIRGRRQVIYARSGLDAEKRTAAAKALT